MVFADTAIEETQQAKKLWQTTKENFKFANIVLIIFAFTDHQETMNAFYEMTDYSQDSLVVHYKQHKNIHSYFQNLTEQLLPDSYEIEEIS